MKEWNERWMMTFSCTQDRWKFIWNPNLFFPSGRTVPVKAEDALSQAGWWIMHPRSELSRSLSDHRRGVLIRDSTSSTSWGTWSSAHQSWYQHLNLTRLSSPPVLFGSSSTWNHQSGSFVESGSFLCGWFLLFKKQKTKTTFSFWLVCMHNGLF